jgi:hypothetical protein
VSQRLANEIFESGDERRLRVERLAASQRGTALFGGFPRLDVDVEQDLGVIADEPHRHDQQPPDAAGRQVPDEHANIGTDPRLGRAARALIGNLELFDAGAFGDVA